ncbi:hypothetical protein DUNSADRAFT_1314 [Dunaliella salina]|uniref:Encoded protein n=1 Tax=Dunaliella salina TaxID=3046 RepID=A0ABQ7FXN8_DUNSA|nr:hypothetical protein DUNSADRAFT_1314 [Dunaliella salina]|eukprot:KAF5827108.1 hypothetical protein DUNSADRAFT_1314 [Dunaliella salina]
MELAQSLRSTVDESKAAQQDTRFLFGTEVSSNYKVPPAGAYETWRPLPVSHLQNQASEAGKHLISHSAIFPRLASSFEEARAKLLPKLNEFVSACKVCRSCGCR